MHCCKVHLNILIWYGFGAERQAHIVVDLSGLRLIDSTGVGRLLCLYKKAKEYGGVVTVHGLRDQPAAIFKLLRLDRVSQA